MTIQELRDWLEVAVANDQVGPDTSIYVCVREGGRPLILDPESVIVSPNLGPEPVVVVNA